MALAIVGLLLVGPASQSSVGQTRTVTARQGVVQSTVSGSGNIEPAIELNLGFKTAGVVSKILVSQGQQVAQGQLLAELDPKSAEVTLEQARASLQAAEAALAADEEGGGETVGSGSAGSQGPAGSQGSGSQGSGSQGSGSQGSAGGSGAGTGVRSGAGTAGGSNGAGQSAATREANIASARAAVSSDRLQVQSDEQALADTRLYAPHDGTIVSLTGEVGETVAATGTTRASGSSSSSAGGSGGAGGSSAGGSGSGRSSAGSSSASGSSSSSSFGVLADLHAMQVVVPLSESEVAHVHIGQPATVTVEALEGAKLAAHVASVATLATSNSGVVSYDVTFGLDQLTAGLRPGMSASVEVVVKQEEGVSVPTSAISRDTVTVVRDGKRLQQTVVTGLAGDSSTIVLSGLQAGEQVVLPLARSSSTSLFSNLTRRAGAGTLGGGRLGGGGGFGGGGGGAVFLRGAGPGGG